MSSAAQQPTRTNGQGLFFVLEGTDGSGKGTQFELLVERLRKAGHDVATFDFPRYDNESSYFVREYLNGKYGSQQQVGPYTASLFYALDRYQAAGEIRDALNQGKLVLANRFTGSSLAHQGLVFDNPDERKGYFVWLDNLEFVTLQIPRPDLSIVLRVPADIAQGLVDKKEGRLYTDKKRDLHEADLDHLTKSVEVYDDLCQLFPKDFYRIDCVRNNELLSIETINDIIWETLQPMLPHKTQKKTTNDDIKRSKNPFVNKTSYGYEVTPEGDAFLAKAVTNTTDDVYAFTDNLGTTTVAAAMARLSRRGDDMRVTILDEFAMSAGKDEKLLQRVITAYGDDSVQQLVGQHVVVENASNILTKKLEWGRLATYLEQSTRYIYFDQKNKAGKYRYHTPEHFPDAVRRRYEQTLDKIFDMYSELVHRATDHVRSSSSVPKEEQDAAWQGATRAQACDAIRPVLPVATTSTVGIFASGQALESLIMHLLSDELPEARIVGQKILDESRKVIPTFLERADKPDRGGATIAYRAQTYSAMSSLTNETIEQPHSADHEAVTLTDYWPKNELNLVPDMLYEHSNLSLRELKTAVAEWPYARKEQVLNSYMGERLNRRHKPGRALENAHYSWDIMCDYGIFRDLQRHRIVDDLEWQKLTPRFGYDIPELVEQAGLTDLYEDCFRLSTELYSYLQTSYPLEAQYATLLGHKMRWKVTLNAREAFHFCELRSSPQGHPGYRLVAQQIHAKIAEVHPLLAGHMKFVNQGEDAELTRLAAERYTQFKLQQLS